MMKCALKLTFFCETDFNLMQLPNQISGASNVMLFCSQFQSARTDDSKKKVALLLIHRHQILPKKKQI
jgi:hypothetical protein